MQNAGLVETRAWIKTARRNVNNLRYADDTTLLAESEEVLRSLLMKVKEESKNAGKAPHSENKDQGIWSHHFMQIYGETMETVRDILFLVSKITVDGDCSYEIKRPLLLQG